MFHYYDTTYENSHKIKRRERLILMLMQGLVENSANFKIGVKELRSHGGDMYHLHSRWLVMGTFGNLFIPALMWSYMMRMEDKPKICSQIATRAAWRFNQDTLLYQQEYQSNKGKIDKEGAMV